ncbi:MAG: biotin transporter BioY [Oscillospiraceae bacterium]|nr:biotin transporter BioY [Oscillospiraceae bacterium]
MKESKKDGIFSLRSMVFTAVFAALICVAAPFSVPVGAVPITLATFAIYLTGALLGGKRGVLAVLVYIMIGAVGLPVFSNFQAGFAVLFGPTGGYIIGYIPLVLLSGLFSDKRRWLIPVGMVLGTVALYTFGTAWFMVFTKANLITALAKCVLPFLIGDSIKIALTTLISVPLKSRLNNILGNNRPE